MAAVVARRVRTSQPQQNVQIDWDNPITDGLVFAYTMLGEAQGWSEDGRNGMPYALTSSGLPTGRQINTPIGSAAQLLTSTSAYIVTAGQTSIKTGVYSLFAFGTAPASGIQSAIDDDNGIARRFQFRINAGKVELNPFYSGGNGSVAAPSALSATDLATGFAMGAVVNGTAYAIYQKGVKTSGSALAGAALTPNSELYIGNRKTGSTQGWLSGGLQIEAMWNRPLTDAEQQSLADNPWQLFRAQPVRRLWLAYSASSGVGGVLLSTLSDATLAAAGQIIDQGSFSSTLDSATMSASGTVGNSPSGSIASALAGASMSAGGNVTNSGAFASTLAGATMASSGTVTNRGALTSTLDGVSMAANGIVSTNATGTLVSTLDGATLAAGGYVGTPPAAPDFFIRLPKNPRHSLRH